MQTRVVTLDAEASMADVFRTFEEDAIGGAPVIDGAGELIGFLSATDLTRFERFHGDEHGVTQRGDASLPSDDELEDLPASRDDYSPEALGRYRVSDWMTHGVITVAPSTSMATLCRKMRDERIHRVVVVDQGAVQGIVSTFDVVRFLADDL